MIDMQKLRLSADRSLLTELISVMASYLATNRLLLTERMIDKFFKRLN